MTVQDVIHYLKEFNSDLEVGVMHHDGRKVALVVFEKEEKESLIGRFSDSNRTVCVVDKLS